MCIIVNLPVPTSQSLFSDSFWQPKYICLIPIKTRLQDLSTRAVHASYNDREIIYKIKILECRITITFYF